jgi:hypothetical protein
MSVTGSQFSRLITLLGILVLQLSWASAQSGRIVFHLARFEYVVDSKCEDPASPVSKLVRSAKEDAAQLDAILASKYPNDECAQRVRAEIQLGIKVEEYVENHGIAIILHLEKADELASQLGKVRSPRDTVFLVHCVLTPDYANANQLDVTCSIKRLDGDFFAAKSFKHPKPPLERLVDLFDEEASDNVTKLCMGRMPTEQQAHR